MSVWRVLLTVLVLLVPASAFAQKEGPTPKYFLLPTQGVRDSVSSIVPERIGELSREQVTKDARIDLMPAYDDLVKQLGGSTAAVAEAEALYTSGIGLLTAGEDQKAAEAFKRALDMMEQNLGDVTNFEVLADTLANLALAYHNAGFDLDARKMMQAYAHMRPNATLDPKKFEDKNLRATFEEEAGKVKKAGNGVLKISSQGEPGIVTIDGVDRGKTPLTVRDVGFGEHYLVVRGGSGKVHAEKIRVRGKQKEQSFKADLGDGAKSSGGGGVPSFYAELLDDLKGGAFSAGEVKPYLKELCAQTGAAYVGFVLMFKEGSSYVAAPFAYSAAKGMLVRGEDVKFNIELSNLLVGVSTLSDSLVSIAIELPEDKVVTDVELGGPPPKEVATNDRTKDPDGTTGDPVGQVEEKDEITPPPDVKKKSGGKVWRWVGITAGGLAVVGLVAGGVYLLSDGGGAAAGGFSTEVQW